MFANKRNYIIMEAGRILNIYPLWKLNLPHRLGMCVVWRYYYRRGRCIILASTLIIEASHQSSFCIASLHT